jgi:hypothetical protein
MRRFEQETFWHNGNPLSLSDASVSASSFNQCGLRSVARGWNSFSHLDLTSVSHWNCAASGCVFDEVQLQDLNKTGSSPLFIWASVFRHTLLAGNISGLKINRSDMNPDATAEDVAWREKETIALYSTIDWALDISGAKFPNGATFEAVPGDKIRRDPESQILIKRDRLAASDWRSLDYQRTPIDIAISWFETGSLFDSVVIASRSTSKHRAADLAVLNMLRREGIAESD